MHALLLLLFTIIFNVVSIERNQPCTIPSGENATCVPANLCKVNQNATLATREGAIEFTTKSVCGYDTEPLICCESSSHPATTSTATTSVFDDFLSVFTPPTDHSLDMDIGHSPDLDIKELPDKSVCGVAREENRIFGGEITKLEEFPWMAALEYKKKSTGEKVGIKCGGSIINNRFILTAAHCVFNLEFAVIGVRLGEWDITVDPDCLPQEDETVGGCADPVQNFTVIEIISHQLYSSKTHENDIALLRLNKEITYTDYIRPICLSPLTLPPPEPGSKVIVVGWGVTENRTEGPSDIKLKVQLPVKPNSSCQKILAKMVYPSQLCAGGEPGKDACQGDSGGPLMRIFEDPTTESSNWYLDGVVSYGIGCGITGHPSVYTRVPSFLNWIKNNIRDPKNYHNIKQLPDRSVCGLEGAFVRRVESTSVKFDQFPWTAILEYTDENGTDVGIKCGGTLINTKFVVTAAECVLHRQYKLVSIRLGDWNLTSNPDCLHKGRFIYECADPVRSIKVEAVIVHPYFTRAGLNNIAIILLKEEVTYNNYIRPICLQRESFLSPDSDIKLTVAGWGITENGPQSEVKLKFTLPLRQNSECNKYLEGRRVSVNQLCAGNEEGEDLCKADLGGPVMKAFNDRENKQTQWYLEGVVSHGAGCKAEGHPMVYTRVSRYFDWIKYNIE